MAFHTGLSILVYNRASFRVMRSTAGTTSWWYHEFMPSKEE